MPWLAHTLMQWKPEDGDVVVFGCGRAMDTSRWAMGTCTCLRKHHEKPALVVARHQKKLWAGCGNRCLHAMHVWTRATQQDLLKTFCQASISSSVCRLAPLRLEGCDRPLTVSLARSHRSLKKPAYKDEQPLTITAKLAYNRPNMILKRSYYII